MSWRSRVVAPHVLLAMSCADREGLVSGGAIAQEKIVAYRETHYSVRAPEPITMRIGIANAPLAAAMGRHASSTCAFLTAYNPCGEAIPDAVNLARHEALRADLAQIGCDFYEGAGGHPDNGWPEEQSFLCFGHSFEQACELGAKLGQDAIVWCDSDAVPVLVLLR
jgi:Protein of unknown function (DUF3293)